ncbi:hypothetical protein ALMA_0099 [Alloscardovia macacae]|uniref:Uncharacterized protein n=1 Tax=Alloscardovia macacae TaxID=1160091 RepID=A0A261F6Q9_9BIFI|nr:hypothetical protein ALMA_0099 [Alloscardovia macacae]
MADNSQPNDDSRWMYLVMIATALAVNTDPIISGLVIALIVLHIITSR